MRIDYVELCGFRGFRDKVRVDFGTGFTIVTGRNGMGKSTLCDAIEFAILGEIGKYSVEISAKETVRDYIWWRGEGTPEAHYVTAAFSDDGGRRFIVTRTREAGPDRSDAEMEGALCQGAVPEDPLRQLCRTSIIRDEWIAALSLDLTETQRFELVRSALGSVEGADLAPRAKAVISAAETASKRVEEAYDRARSELSATLVQLSEATDAAARSTDVSAAMTVLDAVVPPDLGALAERLDRARRDIHERRRRVEARARAAFESREITGRRDVYDGPAARERRNILSASRDEARVRADSARSQLAIAERALEVESRASAIAASLSAVVEHGERLGLHDGRCPLCDADRSMAEYEEGLALARQRIDALAAGVNAARDAFAEAGQIARAEEASWSGIEAEWQADAAALATLREREGRLAALFQSLGLDPDLIADPDAIERDLSTERERLLGIEQALYALQASQAVGRLASVDARVAGLRRQVDAEADGLARAQQAVAAAKSLEKSVRRSAGEIVDERLALISPLLNELYQRLRPHSDWRSIEYSIRGDVRRLLSLKVGNDLNPQFVFSSGQRRAAGLAFLLSVHLARSWARWTTLVLDDPVQHIDDFRALHLVEVLSALRQSGRQVICAVEDEALADLLCRRLLSTGEQPGRRVRVDVGERGSADIVAVAEIAPTAVSVLRGPDQSIAS